MNLCKENNCKWWGEGKKDESTGSIYGYGCKRFTVSDHCPVAFIQGAKANQYCVYLEDGAAPIKSELAAFCIAHIDELTKTPDYVVESEEAENI